MTTKTDLFNGRPKKMLHVAPEPQLSTTFQEAAGIDYLSADLCDPRAMVSMDLTDIQYPDNSFDVIYCSHVLEHIPDDRRAMRELHRVLAIGGWSILAVPLYEQSVEDPSVTSPEDRLRLFGQPDHVRKYSETLFTERLEESGFAVTVDGLASELSPRKVRRLGLNNSGSIYLCKK